MTVQARPMAGLIRALLGLSICGAAWGVCVPASAQSPHDLERAEAAFALGSQAFEEGRYPEALSQMQNAFAAAPNYRTAAGLGQVELHLGQFRDAAQHLDFSLRKFPSAGDPEGRRRVMDGLAEARAHVFTLAVRSEVTQAPVFVDGKKVGTTPIEHDLYLEPGERMVRVEAPGYAPFMQELYAPAGAQKELGVVWVPIAATEVATQQGARSEHAWWVLGVGGSAALLGAGAGLGFWVDAKKRDDRAGDLARELSLSKVDCGTAEPTAECGELTRLRDDAERQAELATVLWVSAAAASVVTTSVFAWLELSESKPRSVSDLSLAPAIGPSSAALRVTGSF